MWTSSWHYDMMHDHVRNAAYAAALRQVVQPEDIVLDIGTGSGLLAMLAARAGAQHVFAVDGSATLAAAAKQLVAHNQLQHRVSVRRAFSTDADAAIDMPCKAHVLVTEIFDSLLLGEGVLPTLRDARARLMDEKAVVVPAGAVVAGMLVSSPLLRERAHLAGQAVPPPQTAAVYEPYHLHVNRMLIDGEITPLTDEIDVLHFDFAHPPAKVAPGRHLTVTATSSGVAHAFVYWWRLNLTADIGFSTSPYSSPGSVAATPVRHHWRQSVCVLANPVPVEAGQQLTLIAFHNDDWCAITVAPPSSVAETEKTEEERRADLLDAEAKRQSRQQQQEEDSSAAADALPPPITEPDLAALPTPAQAPCVPVPAAADFPPVLEMVAGPPGVQRLNQWDWRGDMMVQRLINRGYETLVNAQPANGPSLAVAVGDGPSALAGLLRFMSLKDTPTVTDIAGFDVAQGAVADWTQSIIEGVLMPFEARMADSLGRPPATIWPVNRSSGLAPELAHHPISVVLAEPFFFEVQGGYHWALDAYVQFWRQAEEFRSRRLPGALIEPGTCTIWAQLVECPKMWRGRAPVGEIEGLDLSPFNTLAPRAPPPAVVDLSFWTGDIVVLGPPTKVARIDISGPLPPSNRLSFKADIAAEQNGTCHGAIMWCVPNKSDSVQGYPHIWPPQIRTGVCFWESAKRPPPTVAAGQAVTIRVEIDTTVEGIGAEDGCCCAWLGGAGGDALSR